MENMPFKCPKCGNWHTPIPMPEDTMCRSCAEGRHAVNAKTGLYDCHWGHMTSTPSEIRMATFHAFLQSVQGKAQGAVSIIEKATSEEAVGGALSEVETLLAQVERDMAEIPTILRWAGVKEMPGRRDADAEDRFKSIEAIEALAKNRRRPQSDVDVLHRSVRTCTMLADEIPTLVSGVRMSVSHVRRAAESWRAPEPIYSQNPAAVKAREARNKKRELVGAK